MKERRALVGVGGVGVEDRDVTATGDKIAGNGLDDRSGDGVGLFAGFGVDLHLAEIVLSEVFADRLNLSGLHAVAADVNDRLQRMRATHERSALFGVQRHGGDHIRESPNSRGPPIRNCEIASFNMRHDPVKQPMQKRRSTRRPRGIADCMDEDRPAQC